MFVVFAAGARTVKMFYFARLLLLLLLFFFSLDYDITWKKRLDLQSVPGNKVIIKVRTMLRSAPLVIGYVESWRYRISWEITPALIAGAPFPLACENIRFSSLFGAGDVSRRARRNGCFLRATFPFPLRAFLPPPSPSFLRLPRRLKLPKDSMRSAVRYRYYYLPVIVISWLLTHILHPIAWNNETIMPYQINVIKPQRNCSFQDASESWSKIYRLTVHVFNRH